MDDIVVIIITLIVALVGILNRKKKKSATQSAAPDTTNEPSGFWDMIMDGGKVQEETVTEYVEPEPVVESFEKPRIKPKYKFSADNEGSSDIKNELKDTLKEKRKVTIEGEEFSLRKAVIYNEILNRKYT